MSATDERITLELDDGGVIVTFVHVLHNRDPESALATSARAPTGATGDDRRLRVQGISSRGMMLVMTYLRGSADASIRKSVRAMGSGDVQELRHFTTLHGLRGLAQLIDAAGLHAPSRRQRGYRPHSRRIWHSGGHADHAGALHVGS